MSNVIMLSDHKEVKEGELCIEWTYPLYKDPWEVVGLAKDILKNYGITVRSLKHTTGNFLQNIDNNLTGTESTTDEQA